MPELDEARVEHDEDAANVARAFLIEEKRAFGRVERFRGQAVAFANKKFIATSAHPRLHEFMAAAMKTFAQRDLELDLSGNIRYSNSQALSPQACELQPVNSLKRFPTHSGVRLIRERCALGIGLAVAANGYPLEPQKRS